MRRDPRIPVLFLLPFRRWGGPGSLLCTLVRKMSRYRAIVAVPDRADGRQHYLEAGADLVEVEGLRTTPRDLLGRRLGAHLLHDGRVLARILARIRGERPVIVHSFTEGLLLGGVAARLLGLRSVLHTIGMTIFDPWPVGLATTRLLDRLSDLILCAQPIIRNEYLAFGARSGRLAVLNNCIEPDAVRKAAGALRPAQGPPVATMVASMDRRKGHDLLVRAVAVLARRGVPLRAQVVGATADDPGFHRELLQMREQLGLQERVEFCGSVDAVPPYLAKATVHVVPSRIEGLPLAGLEAMSLGLPVVATRVGGNSYMVEHDRSGLLTQAEDPEALADGLEAVLTDPARAARLGEAARQRVAELFDSRVVAARMEKLYDGLLGVEAS